MDTTEEIASKETDNENHTEHRPEFTFSDAEALLNSALEIQQKACRKLDGVEINSLPMDLDMALSNFIGKLKKWVTPFMDSKRKLAQSLGFALNGNSYSPIKKMTEDEKLSGISSLITELGGKNEEAFEHWENLKNIIPIKAFTEARVKEANVYFKDCPNRQMFLEYCLKQPDQP